MIRRLLHGASRRLPFALDPLQAPYRAFRRRLRIWESLPTEEIRRRQLESLQQVVELAYQETDWYRQTFDRAGFHPRQLRRLEDLERIPVITKDDVRAHGLQMIRRGLDRRHLGTVSTSGTTGSPLTLWLDGAAAARERAAIHCQWERVGFRRGQGRVELRGIFEGEELLRSFPQELVLRVNINRLEVRTLPEIVRALNACPYPNLHGYPHAVERFARLLEETGLASSLRHPRAILLGSEGVLETQFQRLRRVFPDSGIISHYGLAERVALGAWTGEDRRLHFLPAYGVAEHDADGCLVGTSLINTAMPLIRYRTTDVLAGHSPEPLLHPWLFPVADHIEGRKHDVLHRTNGDFLSPVMANHALLAGEGFGACQLVQHALDHVELIVEPEGPEGRARASLPAVERRLREVFGPELRVELTLVERIPRGPGGKFPWVVSKLVRSETSVT